MSWLSLFIESAAYVSAFTKFSVRILSEQGLSVHMTEDLACW